MAAMKSESTLVVTTANDPGGKKRRVEIEYNFGSNLDEMVKRFGANSVYYNARASMIISIQAAVRSWVKKGLNADEINDAMKVWEMPSKTPARNSHLERISKDLDRLSESERKALLSKLLSTSE
jgi:hypothetical protein